MMLVHKLDISVSDVALSVSITREVEYFCVGTVLQVWFNYLSGHAYDCCNDDDDDDGDCEEEEEDYCWLWKETAILPLLI